MGYFHKLTAVTSDFRAATVRGFQADFSRLTKKQLNQVIQYRLAVQAESGLPEKISLPSAVAPGHRGLIGERGLVDRGAVQEGLAFVETSPADGGFKTLPKNGGLEWWYGHVRSRDAAISFAFCTSDLMGSHGLPQLWLIYHAQGRDRLYQGSIYPDFDPTDFSADHDHCDVRLGDNRLWVEYPDGCERPGVWHLHLAVEDGETKIKLDLTAEPRNKGWKPGTTDIFDDPGGGDFSYAVLAFPSDGVQGELTIDGEKFGLGDFFQVDHNFGDKKFGKALDKWYWAQIFTPLSAGEDFFSSILSQIFFRPAVGRKPLNIVGQFLNNNPLDSAANQFQVQARHWCRDKIGTNYPTTLTFVPKDENDPTEITITSNGPPIFRRNLLDGKNWLVRWLGRIFKVCPVMFRFDGNVLLTLADPKTHEIIVEDFAAKNAGEFEIVVVDNFWAHYEALLVSVKKYLYQLLNPRSSSTSLKERKLGRDIIY